MRGEAEMLWSQRHLRIQEAAVAKLQCRFSGDRKEQRTSLAEEEDSPSQVSKPSCTILSNSPGSDLPVANPYGLLRALARRLMELFLWNL